jgi:hypothetical protein
MLSPPAFLTKPSSYIRQAFFRVVKRNSPYVKWDEIIVNFLGIIV